MRTFSTLDAGAIVKTIGSTARRIEERFPGASLSAVAQELLSVSGTVEQRALEITQPRVSLRIAVAVVIALLVISIVATVPVAGVGPYAVFVLHDANGDNVLNTASGRPLEGYGLSGGLDPYSPTQDFKRAAIVSNEASVRVVYLTNPYR